jgi:hypothetical protein
MFAGLAPMPEAAASQTMPVPTVDYEIHYRLAGRQTGTMVHRFSRSGGTFRMDITMGKERMSGVFELGGGPVRLWSPSMPGMVMRIDGARNGPPIGVSTGNSASALGERCENWKTEGSLVCVAADGIPLGFESEGVKATAIKIERKAQDAKLFIPPKGQEMVMPGGAAMRPPGPF